MKKLLIFALLSIFFKAEASHLLGGEISWECLPTGQYMFTLTLYRDCTGIPLSSTTQNITTNAGVNITCTKIGTNYINKECFAPSCQGASVPYIGAVERHVYRSGPITITAAPPASGFYFTWSTCCRPGTITNLQNPGSQGFLLRAIMYPFVPPGATTPLSLNPCYDSSPTFEEKPSLKYCGGNQVLLNASVTDIDQDSIYYSWADPAVGGAMPPFTSVLWNTIGVNNYSSNNPFPDTAQNANNIAASLDANSGLISFKSFTNGAFVHCVKASAHRNGQLISETFRDVPIFIKGCSTASQCNSTPPTYSETSFTWNNSTDTIFLDSTGIGGAYQEYYRYQSASVGDSIKFVFNAFDTDSLPNCMLENIKVSAHTSGFQLTVLPSSVNCSNPPCAQFYSLNQGGGYVHTLQNKVGFKWAIDCNVAPGTKVLWIEIENNTCPLPTVKTVKLVMDIEVDQTTQPVFDTINSALDPVNNKIDLFWSKPDTGVSFHQYVLWHSTGSQPVILDSLKSYSDTFYSHLNPPSGLNQYWIRAMLGCANSIDSVSIQDTANIIILKNNIGLETNDQGIRYYPLPMSNKVVFEGFGNDSEVNIEMVNAVGAVLRRETLNATGGLVNLDVSDLPTGIYVFVLFWDGHSSKIKLVKHE